MNYISRHAQFSQVIYPAFLQFTVGLALLEKPYCLNALLFLTNIRRIIRRMYYFQGRYITNTKPSTGKGKGC